MLALVVAIEAVRAGEQARGLSASADEVRSLGARIGRSSGRIRGILSQLQERAQRAVHPIETRLDISRACSDNVREVENLFDRVGMAVSATSDINHVVARAAEHQRRVVATANSRLIDAQRMTTETVDPSADVMSGVETAEDAAEGLEALINRFRARGATTEDGLTMF